jgi:cobalt-zinc-cadmium efflux system protein
MSLIIIAVIPWSNWRLFNDSIDLALDAVPQQNNQEEVRSYLLLKDSIDDIHDLHIWATSTRQIAMTVHLVVAKSPDDQLIKNLQKELRKDFGITHISFQIEDSQIEQGCETGCE